MFLVVTAAVISSALSGCLSFRYSSNNSDDTPPIKVTEYTSDEIFETIASALAEYDNNTEYDAKLGQETIDKAVRKVKHFHPDYFWLNGYTTTSVGDSTTLEFMTLNDYSADELRQMHDELMSAVNDVISQVPTSLGEYEQALFVHDFLVNNTRYATEKLGVGYNGLWGNAYGCLVEGSAVCQGYAEAYSLIMQRLGIECGVCSGKSDRGSHAWNYIKIDGSYYWTDVTWDDPESENDEGGDRLRHNYFMINDELLLRTRSLDDDQYFIPSCDSMDRNYFVMTNAYLNGYNPDEIGRILADNAESGCAEMMFADEAGFTEAVNGLFEEQEIWELSEYAELGYTLSYACDDRMYVLEINY